MIGIDHRQSHFERLSSGILHEGQSCHSMIRYRPGISFPNACSVKQVRGSLEWLLRCRMAKCNPEVDRLFPVPHSVVGIGLHFKDACTADPLLDHHPYLRNLARLLERGLVRIKRTLRSDLSVRGRLDDPIDEVLVSIVVPAHNEARIIERCARGLMAQKWSSLEIIFVADRCTDETVDILPANDGRRSQDPNHRKPSLPLQLGWQMQCGSSRCGRCQGPVSGLHGCRHTAIS